MCIVYQNTKWGVLLLSETSNMWQNNVHVERWSKSWKAIDVIYFEIAFCVIFFCIPMKYWFKWQANWNCTIVWTRTSLHMLPTCLCMYTVCALPAVFPTAAQESSNRIPLLFLRPKWVCLSFEWSSSVSFTSVEVAVLPPGQPYHHSLLHSDLEEKEWGYSC